MSTIRSLTISKDLIERLQHPICCSGSEKICRDDGFCGSHPATWPTTVNGDAKVRLAYPPDDRPSIEDVAGLCSAYMAWDARTNCAALGRDIAKTISTATDCAISIDPQIYIRRILREVPKKKRKEVEHLLQEHLEAIAGASQQRCDELASRMSLLQSTMVDRCQILYEEDPTGEKRFNEDRAEDLGNIAAFCQPVQEANQAAQRAESKKFNWKLFLTGGGTAAGVGGLTFLLWKVAKAIFHFGSAISNTAQGINRGARGIKYLFGVAFQNVRSTLKYIFSGGWLRHEPPPPDVVAPPPEMQGMQPTIEIHVHSATGPKSAVTVDSETTTTRVDVSVPPADGAEAADPVQTEATVEPHANVVRAEFASLASGKRFAREGALFGELSERAQLYLSNLIIAQWDKEPADRRRFFIREDNRPLHGKIPIDYLFEFAGRYLKREMLPLIEESAKDWEATGQIHSQRQSNLLSALDFEPVVEEVQRQLLSDARFLASPEVVQRYIARLAISRFKGRGKEPNPALIGDKEDLRLGALPSGFLRVFEREEMAHFKVLEQRAMIFQRILYVIPELSGAPFELLDARAEMLRQAWEQLPRPIQQEFLLLDRISGKFLVEAGVSLSFVVHMRPALKIGVVPRDAIEPAAAPWALAQSPALPYRGYDLRAVMNNIVRMNAQIAFYPLLLEQRARSTVDSWEELQPDLQARFLEQDVNAMTWDEMMTGGLWIPRSYVEFWYATGSGVGTASRAALEAAGAPPAAPKVGEGATAGAASSRRSFAKVEVVDAAAETALEEWARSTREYTPDELRAILQEATDSDSTEGQPFSVRSLRPGAKAGASPSSILDAVKVVK